jgi:hypothetical protein
VASDHREPQILTSPDRCLLSDVRPEHHEVTYSLKFRTAPSDHHLRHGPLCLTNERGRPGAVGPPRLLELGSRIFDVTAEDGAPEALSGAAQVPGPGLGPGQAPNRAFSLRSDFPPVIRLLSNKNCPVMCYTRSFS